MGITIHYRFGIEDEKVLERILTKIKEIAEKEDMKIMEFEIKENRKSLIILPHENSETINLEFEKWENVKKRVEEAQKWDYVYETLRKSFNETILEDLWVCSDFTKTQFAGDITHIKVCEILRILASFCSLVKIYDEAHYYETRDKEKLINRMGENAKLIKAFANALKEKGYNVISGFDMQETNTT